MQQLSGILLIAVGVTLAGYSYLPPPQLGAAATIAEAQRSDPAPPALTGPSDAIRTFSPTSSAFFAHEPMPVPAVAAIDPEKPSRAWTAVVTVDPGRSALKSPKPADFATRVEIVRDLQRELKRVGCYGGVITGIWSPASREAMAEFMDRVNATLPTDEPDYILLTLLQSRSGVACTSACPKGQVLSAQKRCVPEAIAAQAARKAKQRLEALVYAKLLINPRAPMAPVAVATSEPEKLPWLSGSVSSSASVPMRQPLPGRMAVGGPVIPLERELAPARFAAQSEFYDDDFAQTAAKSAEMSYSQPPAQRLQRKASVKSRSSRMARRYYYAPRRSYYAANWYRRNYSVRSLVMRSLRGIY
jgi:hypothetical protein